MAREQPGNLPGRRGVRRGPKTGRTAGGTRGPDLARARRAQEEFLSRAGDELRAPMRHVLGFAQRQNLAALTRDEGECVQQILTSGHYLLGLVDRILSLAESAPEELGFPGENR